MPLAEMRKKIVDSTQSEAMDNIGIDVRGETELIVARKATEVYMKNKHTEAEKEESRDDDRIPTHWHCP